jgi:hypothetical protein
MAGLAGRIKYLYEDDKLTFSELKRILELISNNSIPLYEKVDGFNCYFSVRNGTTPVMARNMTDINNGGLSIVELANRKFAGGSDVKRVFIEALKNFAKDVTPIERTARRNIFESAGNQVFYNFEIVDKNTKRLFEYDSNGLILHDTGHFVLSEGKRVPFKNNLGNFKASLKESQYIKTNLKTSLTEHANNTINSVINKIDELLEQNSFAGYNRIGDLQDSNAIKNLLNEFSCNFINSLQSNLIKNESEKVKSFKNKLKEAVSSLLNYEGEDKAAIVEKTIAYLKEFPDVDLIDSCIEGVVFEHNNSLYKLTGYYGPINQLYSLYQNKVLQEYNSGHHFPLDTATYAVDNVMTTPDKKTIAIFPGSFKPPHAGHYKVVEELLNRKNPEGFHVINNVVVLISNKARMAQSPEASVYITADISEQLWKLYTETVNSDARVDVRIADHDTPIKCIFDYMLNEMAPTENLLLIKSSKDKDSDRFNIFDKFSRDNGLDIQVEIEEMNVYSAGVSASNMRNWIADNDEGKFKGFLPDHLAAEEQEEAWQIVRDTQDISLNESNSFFLESDLEEEQNVIKPTEIPPQELIIQAVKWEYSRGRSTDLEGLYNVVLTNLEDDPVYYNFLSKDVNEIKKKDLNNLSENQGWSVVDIVDAMAEDFGYTDASDAPPWMVYCAETLNEVQHYQSLLTENRVQFIKDTYPDKLTNAVMSRWDYEEGLFNITSEELLEINWSSEIEIAIKQFLKEPENKWANQFPVPKEYKESLVQFFLNTDPTKSKQYAQWLIIRFIKDKERIEDIHTMNPVLVDFHEMVERDIITGVDINKLSIRDLQNLVREKADVLRAKRVKSGDEEAVQDVIDTEVEILYKEGDSMMAIPTTMRAACVLGKDTNWCTAVDDEQYNVYSRYAKNGPLITFFVGDRKWQLHFESNQFMDENDDPVNFKAWLIEHSQFKEPILDYYEKVTEEKQNKQRDTMGVYNLLVGRRDTIADFVDLLYFKERKVNKEIVAREIESWINSVPMETVGSSKINFIFEYALENGIYDKKILDVFAIMGDSKIELMNTVLLACDDSQFKYFLNEVENAVVVGWLRKLTEGNLREDELSEKEFVRIQEMFREMMNSNSYQNISAAKTYLMHNIFNKRNILREILFKDTENVELILDYLKTYESSVEYSFWIINLLDYLKKIALTPSGEEYNNFIITDYFIPFLADELKVISKNKNTTKELFVKLFRDIWTWISTRRGTGVSHDLGDIAAKYDLGIAESLLEAAKKYIQDTINTASEHFEEVVKPIAGYLFIVIESLCEEANNMIDKNQIDAPSEIINNFQNLQKELKNYLDPNNYQLEIDVSNGSQANFHSFSSLEDRNNSIEGGSLNEIYEEEFPSLIEKVLPSRERPIIIWMSKNHKDETDDIFLKTKLRAHELGIDPTEIYYAPFDEYTLEKHDLIKRRISGENSWEFAIVPNMNAKMHWYLKNLETDNHLSQKAIQSYDWNSINEVSEKPAQIAHNFMRQAEKRGGLQELPFSSIFGDKKTRIVLEMPKEYTGEMKDLMNFINKAGWDLNPKTGNVTREYKYKIPKGPKKGEEINKKEEISLGKLLEKGLSMFKSLHKSCDDLRKKIDDNIDGIEKIYKGNLPSMMSRRSEFVMNLFSDVTPLQQPAGFIRGFDYTDFFKNFYKEKQDILDKYNQLVKTFGKSVPNLAQVLDYLRDTHPTMTFVYNAYFQQEINGNKIIKFINFWNSNSEKFITNPSSMMDGNKIIVSRHPIDVLRMSDFRNLHSCHSEKYSGESYFYCAVYESQGLGAISYIVSSEDYNLHLEMNNIENPEDENSEFQTMEIFADPNRNIDGMEPLSRRRIKRYIISEGYDEFEMAIPSKKTYGKNLPYYYETLRDFLYSNQIDDIINKFGFESEEQLLSQGIPVDYVHPTGGTYRDTGDEDGALFNNFFDGEYKYDDYDFGEHIGDEDEEGFKDLVEFVHHLEEIHDKIESFEHISVDVDFSEEGDNRWDVYISPVTFNIDLEEAIYQNDLDELEAAEDFDWEELIEEMLLKQKIISANRVHVYQRGSYLDFDIEVENDDMSIMHIDDVLALVKNNLADFDEKFEELMIRPLLYTGINKGLFAPDKDSEVNQIIKLIKTLPFEHLDIEQRDNEILVGKSIYIGEMLNLPQNWYSYQPNFSINFSSAFMSLSKDFYSNRYNVNTNLFEGTEVQEGFFSIQAYIGKDKKDSEQIQLGQKGQNIDNIVIDHEKYPLEVSKRSGSSSEPPLTLPLFVTTVIRIPTEDYLKDYQMLLEHINLMKWHDKTNLSYLRKIYEKTLSSLNEGLLERALRYFKNNPLHPDCLEDPEKCNPKQKVNLMMRNKLAPILGKLNE